MPSVKRVTVNLSMKQLFRILSTAHGSKNLFSTNLDYSETVFRSNNSSAKMICVEAKKNIFD